jgi:methionyl aminopeptidase
MFSRIERKTPAQLEVMRAAGLVVASTLQRLSESVRPGVTTAELDGIAREHIRAAGATSNFLGYHGFPAVICTSVNDEVVHGIPGDRTLADGDLLSIDCGAIVDGWHGDAAITIAVGQASTADTELMRVTREALQRGIAALKPGAHVGDVGWAIQAFVESESSLGIVEGYTGHGIGTAMHMPPDVPNVGRPGHGPKLRPGMVIAIEPMITAGDPATHTLDDGWTVVTDDGARAAHFEHTVAITAEGPRVLTRS